MRSSDKALQVGTGKNEVSEVIEKTATKTYRVSEAIFTVLVAIAIVGVPWWILRYDARQAASAGDGLVLNVVGRNDTGQKGKWLIRPVGNWNYGANGALSDIRVREGQQVILRLTSIDVEHEFSLPDYDIKAKVNPGKVTTVRFVAKKAGKFKFECTSYCREGHDEMAGRLFVVRTSESMGPEEIGHDQEAGNSSHDHAVNDAGHDHSTQENRSGHGHVEPIHGHGAEQSDHSHGRETVSHAIEADAMPANQ